MVQRKKKSIYCRYILNRIKNNKNFMAMVTGPTGSGKSWATLSLAEELNEDFNITRVVFSFKQLMEIVNDPQYKNKKGICIVFDEAGIDVNSKNFMSKINKSFNYLIQTFRHRNFILLFTAPYPDFVDSATRKMFHCHMETIKINKELKTTYLKPKLIQYNGNMKKYYYKYLIVRGKKIKKIEVPKPSDELIRLYEEKKTLFTRDLNKVIEYDLVDEDNKVVNQKTALRIKIKEAMRESYMKGNNTLQKIADDLNMKPNSLAKLGGTGFLLDISKEMKKIPLKNPVFEG